MSVNELFASDLSLLNIGPPLFADLVTSQGGDATTLAWSPPCGGNPELIQALIVLESGPHGDLVETANAEAVGRITAAHPVLVGFEQAINVVPGMTPTTILHAGPPISWERMSGAMRGAVLGALVFEGLATDPVDAARVAASGDITFASCHDHDCVGSMAGVTSASMYMHIVENQTHGNFAYSNLSEQLAQVLRMGANDEAVIDRLRWMRDVLGPMLREAVQITGPIDARMLLAQALQMGDECHNRNTAGTVLELQALAPGLARTGFTDEQKASVFNFVASSDYFSGPLWMATAKAALDAAHGIANSTLVTAMARNGVEFGIKVSGTGRDTWFTGPAQRVVGPMFAGYRPEDSGLDIGDSAITETYGIGGFAMAAAPAIVPLVGGTVEEAIDFTYQMTEITAAENPHLTIPLLDFRGVPTGIDVRKVIATGDMPIINTAIAHKEPGVGMIGAGITHPPTTCFESALLALAAQASAGAAGPDAAIAGVEPP